MPKNVQTHTIVLISHASKVILKILQVKLQKNIYFCFTDYSKAFDCMDHNK